MKAYALLGAPEENWPHNIREIFLEARKAGNLIIGVDRGSLLLNELGIVPDLAIGDFDQLKKFELAELENSVPDIRYSNPIKDLTDSELMIKVAFEDYQVEDLTILGATGGRIDHYLVNLLMMLRPSVRKFIEKVTLIDKQNEIRFYNPGKHLIKKAPEYFYFGIWNLTPVKNLNILKARYELKNFSSDYQQVFSSNEFRRDQSFFELDFEKGIVAVIFSKDIDRFHNVKRI